MALQVVHDGKEKGLSFGSYPDVGLQDARRRRDAALAQLDEDIDPAVEKRRQKLLTAETRDLTFSAGSAIDVSPLDDESTDDVKRGRRR